jgi:hypothetical protein
MYLMDARIAEFKEKLKPENTLLFVVYSILSGSIYSLIWLTEKKRIFEAMSKTGIEVIDKTLIIAAAICYGDIFALLIMAIIGVEEYSHIGQTMFALFYFAGTAILIVIAFKCANVLEKFISSKFKVNLRLNRILLLLFSLFYINYIMNNIDTVIEKQKTLENAITDMSKEPTGNSLGGVPPYVGAEELTSRLERLGMMKEKGILTEEEFAAQKAKLLG